MSDTNTDPAVQPETLTKSEVASFCRHLGRSLKGITSNDPALAAHLMRESEYLENNHFSAAAEMFATVAAILDPNPPKRDAS
ncbi:hypothetical protein ACIQW9_04635 [Herminiimonas sp. NPDC097707]|uniref:hypothetical protein n=1 Tax=Herminiimonas sp. NPDC097707 TaxID=3364007 RepID=UPI00383A23A2